MDRVILSTEDNSDNKELTLLTLARRSTANTMRGVHDGFGALDGMFLNQVFSLGTEKGGR